MLLQPVNPGVNGIDARCIKIDPAMKDLRKPMIHLVEGIVIEPGLVVAFEELIRDHQILLYRLSIFDLINSLFLYESTISGDISHVMVVIEQ